MPSQRERQWRAIVEFPDGDRLLQPARSYDDVCDWVEHLRSEYPVFKSRAEYDDGDGAWRPE
jgi:hypothetical protein